MIVDKDRLRDFDTALLGVVFLIFAIGLISIHSATQAKHLSFAESYVFRQLNWLTAGLILLFIAVKISYQKFVDLSYFLYAINILLLALVLVVGHARLGAQRWFTIGSFAFQPSEFMKLSFILALSNYVGQRRDAMSDLKSLIVPCLLLGAPFILVLLQPDLGTALLMVPVFFAILLAGGARVKYIFWMIGIGLAGLPVFWHFLRDYQQQRLLVFLNPNIDPLGSRLYDHTIEDRRRIGWPVGQGLACRHAEPAQFSSRAAHGLHILGYRRGMGVHRNCCTGITLLCDRAKGADYR
jgi:rod shape determining protein RodA